jgi:HEPN domain-containing protein
MIISFGFWSHSKEFLSAAHAVKNPEVRSIGKEKFKLIFPACYLVGHSIELSLKSYLAAKGYKIGKLRSRKYGHNLEALFKEARKRKLGREVKLSKQQVKAIKLLNETYMVKKFEYLEYGQFKLPEYGFIYEVAECLLKGLEHYASNSPLNKRYHLSAFNSGQKRLAAIKTAK